MNTSTNRFDALESLIFEDGLRIDAINIHQELDLLLVILNTKAVLRHRLSDYPLLKAATTEQLLNYGLIGSGTGIHWPDLDEDLSLKGFLRDELRTLVGGQKQQAA